MSSSPAKLSASIQNIAVFCASANGRNPAFIAAATELGEKLAARKIGLIYGGAKVGLMAAVANAALGCGGRVVGVIPHVLVDLEVAHRGVTELHVVDTMHTRKALIGEKSDAFVILPGGFGTLEEMFEVLAWQTLNLHAKPIVMLNTGGFYDGLLRFLADAEVAGILKRESLAILRVVDTVEGLFGALGI